jgi:hypothetical protein
MGDIKEHGPTAIAPEAAAVEKMEVVNKDIVSVERVVSTDMEKNFMNYERVDVEVAKCTLE